MPYFQSEGLDADRRSQFGAASFFIKLFRLYKNRSLKSGVGVLTKNV